MATRAPFLTTRFGGYHHRDVPQEDTELTHVGPGTPCGEYFRRFWQPICFSDMISMARKTVSSGPMDQITRGLLRSRERTGSSNRAAYS